MESLLYLLLELKRAQLSLSHIQSARNARTELHVVRTNVVPTVAPVTTTLPPVTSTAQPAPTAPVSTQPASDFRTQVEQYVLADTNAARAQNGLSALTLDTRVAVVARAHSEDMLAHNYFEHANLQGCDPGCRLTNAGYTWRSYGENIHWMQGYNLSAADTAQKIVTDWLNSPPHRANMLGAFTYAGVGIAVSGDKVYTTTDYTTQ
jgi:uncharacterized protein YkwD